jgi:hypothetical protein
MTTALSVISFSRGNDGKSLQRPMDAPLRPAVPELPSDSFREWAVFFSSPGHGREEELGGTPRSAGSLENCFKTFPGAGIVARLGSSMVSTTLTPTLSIGEREPTRAVF